MGEVRWKLLPWYLPWIKYIFSTKMCPNAQKLLRILYPIYSQCTSVLSNLRYFFLIKHRFFNQWDTIKIFILCLFCSPWPCIKKLILHYPSVTTENTPYERLKLPLNHTALSLITSAKKFTSHKKELSVFPFSLLCGEYSESKPPITMDLTTFFCLFQKLTCRSWVQRALKSYSSGHLCPSGCPPLTFLSQRNVCLQVVTCVLLEILSSPMGNLISVPLGCSIFMHISSKLKFYLSIKRGKS